MWYLWLCLYTVNTISHNPEDVYTFLWLVLDLLLASMVVTTTIIFITPKMRRKALEPKPTYVNRHGRPANAEIDEMLARLVEIRRNGGNGLTPHKELQRVS